MVLIPAINANNLVEFLKNLIAFKKKSILLHIDIFDGKYCKRKNYFNLFFLKFFKFSNLIEFHLMIKDVDANLERFLKVYPSRVCVDINEVKDYEYCYNLAKRYGADLGLFVSDVREIKVNVDFVVIMGVTPGASGQKLREDIFSRIEYYTRDRVLLVGVDGGVNENNILSFKEKGLGFICSGSMIFKSDKPVKKFNEIQNLINEKF